MKQGLLVVVGVLLFTSGIVAGVLLERWKAFEGRQVVAPPQDQPDDTAALLVGRWQQEGGSEVTEYTADGRFSSPEVVTLNGKVTSNVTWGTYRFVGPRQVEHKFRLEWFAKKPEFTVLFTIKEITPDRLVTVDDKSGEVSTAKRVRE